MLERAVALDPNYAPAWEALGRRYYFDAIYAGGGTAQYERSNAAYRKVLNLSRDASVLWVFDHERSRDGASG